MFSKVTQNDETDILGALSSVPHTLKETSKLGLRPIGQWPTYAATMRNIVLESEDDDCTIYQWPELRIILVQ